MFGQFNQFNFDRISRDKVSTGDIIEQNPASDYEGERVNSKCSSDRSKNSCNVTTAQSWYSK
jgi:hypothetical protein